MGPDGVAVTIYFGSKDNYEILGFAGNRVDAKKYFTNLIRRGEVVEIGRKNINFALVTEFEIRG